MRKAMAKKGKKKVNPFAKPPFPAGGGAMPMPPMAPKKTKKGGY